jgi:hypothetical protein
VVFEVLLDLGLKSVAEPFRSRKNGQPIVAALGLLLLGALIGGLTSLVLPNRVFDFHTPAGISLIVSPLITGLVMEFYGRWSDARGRPGSSFATWWGGALFAFGMAAARFYFVSG